MQYPQTPKGITRTYILEDEETGEKFPHTIFFSQELLDECKVFRELSDSGRLGDTAFFAGLTSELVEVWAHQGHHPITDKNVNFNEVYKLLVRDDLLGLMKTNRKIW